MVGLVCHALISLGQNLQFVVAVTVPVRHHSLLFLLSLACLHSLYVQRIGYHLCSCAVTCSAHYGCRHDMYTYLLAVTVPVRHHSLLFLLSLACLHSLYVQRIGYHLCSCAVTCSAHYGCRHDMYTYLRM